MHLIWLLLGGIVLAFCGVVLFAALRWRLISTGKRIAAVLLLTPHLLVIVCILTSLSYGHPAPGSPAFNTQFICGVLIVFILPLPALIGTLVTVGLLASARARA